MAGEPRQRKPRAHWVMLAMALLGCLGLLLVAGLTSGELGESAQAPPPRPGSEAVPGPVRSGGPIIDPSKPDQPGLSVPEGHVVLTFDDGPTDWTAKVLDVLAAHHVRATFFVVGARAAERPDLIRRMRAQGDQVGVHTFTHVDLADVPAWRQRMELNQTQLVIAGATGHTTNLARAPYSSTVRALRPAEWQVVQRAVHYRVVFTDRDTEDWSKPGVRQIVANGLPSGGAGAVITLHDGGGDRAQTLAALSTLIDRLEARGYTFDTVTSAIGAPSPWQPATTSQRFRGELLSWVVRSANFVVRLLELALVAVIVLAVLRTLLLLLALVTRRLRGAPAVLPNAVSLSAVSVVVPAFNEELGIGSAVRSLAASRYPELEIIVVDDGSTDSTAAMVEALGLPNVAVIRQENVGRPGALNTGIAAASHDILVLVDADTVVEPSSMRALVAAFSDPEVGAVSGTTKVGNRRGLLGRWQHLEYVTGFNLDRRMVDVLRWMPTTPGTIAAFRRETLEAVGGVSNDTLAETSDLSMSTCRAAWRVVHAPDARAWTEAPTSWRELWRQRYRWCYGTMQAMWKHRRAVLEGGPSGRLGRRGLPYLLAFHVLLPLLAPVVDVLAVYSLVFLAAPTFALVWLALLALELLRAACAFRLDDEPYEPLWSLPLQQFVYRQLMCLVVIQSVASAIYGIGLRRHGFRRTGDMDAVPPAPPFRATGPSPVNSRVNTRV